MNQNITHKEIRRLLFFVFIVGLISVFLGPIISCFVFNSNELFGKMGRILLAWIFGAIYSIVPVVIVFLLGVLVGGLNSNNSIKNWLILLFSLIGSGLELLWAEKEMHISSELGCYFYGLLIGYNIPIVGVFILFRPFKSKVPF